MNENPFPDALYVRPLESGMYIVVYKMMFNTRVCYGDRIGIENSFCYPTRASALAAASIWDGQGDAPDGWIKHVNSYRYRPDGDPKHEYDQRYPEPRWEEK